MRLPIPGTQYEIDLGDLDRRVIIGVAGGFVLIVIALLSLVAFSARPVDTVAVTLTSDPPGATVRVGGRSAVLGTTPLEAQVPAGADVTLELAGYVPYRVSFTRDSAHRAQLLRGRDGRPVIWRARHTIPAPMQDVRFAPDGRTVTYQVGAQRWSYDLVSEKYTRLDLLEFVGGGTLDPTGRYLLQIDRGDRDRHQLRLVDTQRQTLDTVLVAVIEDFGTINDVGWLPDGKSALVAFGRGSDGQSRLARIDPFSRSLTTVVEVPSVIISGGPFNFSPDGNRVAFFLNTGRRVLAYVDLRDPSTFRQIADLALAAVSQTSSSSNPSFVGNPSVWSADGTKLYFIAPQPRDIPTDPRQYVRTYPPTLWVSDLQRQPRVVSFAGAGQGEPVHAVGRAGDDALLALYRDPVSKELSLYRVLPDQNAWSLVQTFTFPTDDNVQAVFSPDGGSFIVYTFTDEGIDRWVYFSGR